VKVLVLGAGAAWSTKDVENGILEGLRAAGLEAGRYAFDQRLGSSAAYLEWVWKQARKTTADTPKPGAQDIALHALGDLLPRAIAHRTDWVVVVSAMFVPKPFLDVLQRAGLPVAVVMTESPYDTAQELEWAQHADLVWTTERSSVDDFARVAPARYLRHAWRPSVHQTTGTDDQVPAHDVVFVGSCFDERAELLSAVDWTGIDLGLYGNWQRLGSRSKLRPFVREGIVDNARAAALYRRASIGLNLYRESIGWARRAPRITHAESLNPRAYELAACGCFHLSSARREVGEIFGDLVPTFTTAGELQQLLRLWLPNEGGRREVSAQLPRAVAGDTWAARGRQMRTDLIDLQPSARQRIFNQFAEAAITTGTGVGAPRGFATVGA